MASSIVGYTNDVVDDIVTYEGGETDTAVVSVDNVNYKIYASVKDGSLTKILPADESISIIETSEGRNIKVNLSADSKNQLKLASDGLSVECPTEAEIDDIRHNQLQDETNIINLTKQVNTLDTRVTEVENEIPTKTSELINDSGFVGTEALSKYATIKYVDDKVDNLKFLTTKFVNSIEEVTEENILYFVPRGGTKQDVYDEYVYTSEHKVERIGGITKDEILTLIKDELDAKQDKLIAGENITITGNVISATGGGSGTSDYEQLSNRPAIDGTVLTKNTTLKEIGVDLDTLATKTEVEEGLAEKQAKLTAGKGINISEDNVISATGGTTGTVTSVNGELPDESGNVTLAIPSIDGLAKQTDLDKEIERAKEKEATIEAKIPSLDNYYTKSEVDAKIPDISDLATKEEVSTVENKIPTKTSDLTNDSGFLTEHQSLAAYRTSADQDVIDAGKQDKLTAGDAIDLTSNTVAVKYDNDTIKLNADGQLIANGAKLQSSLTSNVTVGGVPAGTTFAEGTSLETIIRQILYIVKTLTGISITSAPSKTAYSVGETFNPSGMVITANYSDGSSVAVTNYTYSPTRALTTADTSITISYTESGITKTANQAITVTEPVSTVDIYYGGTDDIPTSISGLNTKTVDKSELVGQFEQNIICDNEDDGQYATFAIPEQFVVNKWVSKGFDTDLPHTLVNKDGYNIYYLNETSYDADLGGINYIFTITEA